MEQLLATTVSHSPDFNQALALGRIHGVLSALIEHCRTSAGRLHTGYLTCELRIRSQGDAFVLSVPDNGVKEELLLAWARTGGTSHLGGGSLSPPPLVSGPQHLPLPPPPLVSGPQHLPLLPTTGPHIALDPSQPRELSIHPLLWVVVFPFAVYFAFSIYEKFYSNVLPIATMIFQFVFFLFFVTFSLYLPITVFLCCVASCFSH